MKRPTFVALGLTAALLLSGCAGTSGGDSAAPNASQPATGNASLDDTSMPPWAAPADVSARVAQAGLDLGPMGTLDRDYVHIAGTIHLEADTEGQVFTLGQFFTEWGVKLTPHQIGGVQAGAGERVDVTSNGEKIAGDPMALRLEPDQQIVLSLG